MKHLPPCRDCDRASRELWHGMQASCRQCQARVVGRGYHFLRVRKRQRRDATYDAVLCAVFKIGKDEDGRDAKITAAHEEVKRAFAHDAMYEVWRAGEPS